MICEILTKNIVFTIFISVLAYHMFTPFTILFFSTVQACTGNRWKKTERGKHARKCVCEIIKSFYITPADIRYLRNLVRYRLKLTWMVTCEKLYLELSYRIKPEIKRCVQRCFRKVLSFHHGASTHSSQGNF